MLLPQGPLHEVATLIGWAPRVPGGQFFTNVARSWLRVKPSQKDVGVAMTMNQKIMPIFFVIFNSARVGFMPLITKSHH